MDPRTLLRLCSFTYFDLPDCYARRLARGEKVLLAEVAHALRRLDALGALACGLLIKVPMSIGGKLDLNPLVNTFVSTVVSGGTFALLSVYINVVSTGGDVMVALATYAAIVFGTATFNAILVQVLAMPLRKVLKR